MSSIIDHISHYQKSIDRSLHDEARLVHCITKLYRLPITVQHLQETGIGRTVNGLRKYEGEVGTAAKALVTKWKTMVAAEESEDGGDQVESREMCDESDRQDHEEDEDYCDESRLQVDEEQNNYQDHHEEEYEEENNPKQHTYENESDHHSEESTDKGSTVSRTDKSSRENFNSSSSTSSKRTSDDHRHKGSSSREGKSSSRHEVDRSKSKDDKSHHSSSSSKHSSSSSSSNRKQSDHDKDRKEKHSSRGSGSGSGSSNSSSSSKKDSSHSSRKESTHSSSKEKHHSSSTKSKEGSHSQRNDDTSAKRNRASEEKELNPTKKVKVEEPSEKHRSSSSSSSSKSSKDKKPSSKPKIKIEKSDEPVDDSDEDVTGLDSTGGASFADALAMIGMPSSSKKKSSVKVSTEKTKKSATSMPPPAAKIKSSKESSSSSSKSSGSKSSSSAPALPLLSQKVKLEPLPEVAEMVEALPTISPHYKPMPLNQTVMECVFANSGDRQQKRHMTEEEVLGHSMQSKKQRMKVYSGQKNNKEGVPTLYNLCIRLLQEHVDLIDYTGGIPFDLLRPVLERATPEQLCNLEQYNPYLMEDSDVLWEQHCKRLFRTEKRKIDECESWREMYTRCSEERNAKLLSLTMNIKQSLVEKAAPVRKTQLAYVDTAVKPPRNVLSKQAKYGTDRTPVVSPAARVAALKNASSNVASVGDSRLKVAPGVRDTAQAQVFHPTKPKKAPMMAKLMTSIKGFKTGFRR